MKLRAWSSGTVMVLDVAGRATGKDAAALRDEVTRLLELGCKHIVINAAELEYLDSAVVGELVACQLRASRAAEPLKLANVERRLRDLLVITRLITVFDTYDSVEGAVESFDDEPPEKPTFA